MLCLFCCFTGLRYSDVHNLKKSDIRDGYIEITTVKTAERLIIELNNHSKAILGELAEINEPVSETYYKGNKRIDTITPKYALLGTHAGRRTFICNALALGIPAQVVMGWGGKVIKKLAQAIRFYYPEKKGYSVRNLAYMCQFARSHPLIVLRSFIETDAQLITPSVQKITDEIQSLNNVPFTQEPLAQIQSTDNKEVAIVQEPLAQIQDVVQTVAAVYQVPIEDMEKLFLASPVARINWASHVILLNSSLPLGVEYWYMKQSVEMGWSSNVLKMQIESKLFERQINSHKVNNFTATLPAPQSDLANYLLKDPYIFDLAGAKERADERDIEEQLVKHVTRYLLEMGNGFAFVARQKHFQIGDSDFYADLILYNIKLHAYVVVELKATPFKPEYAGQLNFYINVVDDKLRGENDNKTIGLLLCKGKDEIVAQYALTGYDQPIGISDYQLSKAVPENLKSALPSIEQVEEELTMLLDNEKNKQK